MYLSEMCIHDNFLNVFPRIFERGKRREKERREGEEKNRERILFEDNIISLYMSLFAFIILTFDLVNMANAWVKD